MAATRWLTALALCLSGCSLLVSPTELTGDGPRPDGPSGDAPAVEHPILPDLTPVDVPQTQDKELPGDVAPPKDVVLPDLGPLLDATCLPACAGKTCGAPDGCGGICSPGTSCTCGTGLAPVCGADQLTYWNACLLQKAGVAQINVGECTSPAVCYITIAPKCPSGAACVTLYLTETGCQDSTNGLGTCWVLPPVCPSGQAIWRQGCEVAGPGLCFERCAAIKQGGWFVQDTINCP